MVTMNTLFNVLNKKYKNAIDYAFKKKYNKNSK